MGTYKCPLVTILKPTGHDDWHGDWHSNVCPVLREEIEKAAEGENYRRLRKLIVMMDQYFPNQ